MTTDTAPPPRPKPSLYRRYRIWRAIRDWKRRDFLDFAPTPIKQEILRHRGVAGAPWIETGTFRGKTTEFLASIAPRVISLEPAPKYFKAAEKKFRDTDAVTILNGTSEALMSGILRDLTGDLNFWLDGHYSGGATFQGTQDCPILDELTAISDNLDHLGQVAILIDDIRCFLPENTEYVGYPTTDFLVDWAREHGFGWRIEHDIMIMKRLSS